MPQYYGNNKIGSVYKGSIKIGQIYKGSTLVYQSAFNITYMVDTGTQYTEKVKPKNSILSPTSFTPTKDGWTFLGWKTDNEATSEILTSAIATKHTTLYAVFTQVVGGKNRYYNNGKYLEPTFTITYALNGGTNSSNNPSSYTYGTAVPLTNISRSTCTFGGWYKDGTKVTEISAGTAGNITLTANFSHSSSCYRSYSKSHSIELLSTEEKNRPSEQLFRFTETYGYYCDGSHTTGTRVYTRSYLSGSPDMGPVVEESKSGQISGSYTHTHTDRVCGY